MKPPLVFQWFLNKRARALWIRIVIVAMLGPFAEAIMVLKNFTRELFTVAHFKVDFGSSDV